MVFFEVWPFWRQVHGRLWSSMVDMVDWSRGAMVDYGRYGRETRSRGPKIAKSRMCEKMDFAKLRGKLPFCQASSGHLSQSNECIRLKLVSVKVGLEEATLSTPPLEAAFKSS